MSPDIHIDSVVRALPGNSKAHLASADDGHLYVVKNVENPEGTRSLWNEWIANRLFAELGISVPVTALLHARSEFDAPLSGRNQVRPSIPRGVHFGSKLPANPGEQAIWDFLPAKLLPQLTNRSDFTKALVIDCLLGKTEHRQAIFIRRPGGFVAYFIDHGSVFSGASWRWPSVHRDCLYFDSRVYDPVTFSSAFAETLTAVQDLSSAKLREIAFGAPSMWLGSTRQSDVESLIISVLDRIPRLGKIVEDALLGMTSLESACKSFRSHDGGFTSPALECLR